jgi:trigger factor
MKISRENTTNLNAVVTVLIEQKDYEKTVSDKLREYRQKASLPGFRPGKVPASLIQKRFAKPVLAEEINNLLSNNLNEFFHKENISLLGDPLPCRDRQKEIDWDKDSDFEFVFDIAIAPEIKIDLSQFTPFHYYKIRVDDKMINDSIESVRMQYGTNTETEEAGEKSSVRGDFVQLDNEGNPVEGGISPKGVLIAVDLIKDETIKNEFIGKRSGDIIHFDPVRAFEDRHEVGHMLNISHEESEALNSTFSFTITSILNFTKAPLDESLFRKVYGEESGINSEEAFRERIKDELAQQLAYSSNRKFAVDARENLITNSIFELPGDFLKRWLKEKNNELTPEQIENDFDGFSRDLRWQLIRNSIIRDFEIGVNSEETMEYAKKIALNQFYQYGVYDVTDEHLGNFAKRILEKEDDREGIVRKIYDSKVIEVVKQHGIVVEKEVTSEEFDAMFNKLPEKES